jgi:transcriptional regulator of acetoin/glycerol metabolism
MPPTATASIGSDVASGMPAMPIGHPAPLAEIERDHIVRTLQQVKGNKAVAARLLGISRRAFYRQLERHGLHQPVPVAREVMADKASLTE